MSYDIVREDERGVVEARFPNSDAVQGLLSVADANSHCLQYIDPYGDTLFNHLQIRRLVEELRDRSLRLVGLELHHANQLLEFLERVLDKPHQYVRLIGD